jgi:hypothetical protein
MEPASVMPPEFTKKIWSTLSMVFKRCAIVGRRLVQDQQFRFSERGAHKRDQLFLAQADAVPAGGDNRVETLGEARNQCGKVSFLQNRGHLLARMILVWLVAVDDVVAHRSAE